MIRVRLSLVAVRSWGRRRFMWRSRMKALDLGPVFIGVLGRAVLIHLGPLHLDAGPMPGRPSRVLVTWRGRTVVNRRLDWVRFYRETRAVPGWISGPGVFFGWRGNCWAVGRRGVRMGRLVLLWWPPAVLWDASGYHYGDWLVWYRSWALPGVYTLASRSRCWGGPEEGGWWYDADSVEGWCWGLRRADDWCEGNAPEHPRWSVLGDDDPVSYRGVLVPDSTRPVYR